MAVKTVIRPVYSNEIDDDHRVILLAVQDVAYSAQMRFFLMLLSHSLTMKKACESADVIAQAQFGDNIRTFSS